MSIQGYQLTDGQFEVTPDIKDKFDKNGFILVRGLLSSDEADKVRTNMENSETVKQYAYGIDDGASRKSQMCLWNQPGNDLTGMVARCEKVAGTCDKLLGGEVYHYHSKLMMKEAFTGGRFAWHQDYGYWYKNTCMFPDMLTVFIALDKCRKENGCLQVMPGSHKCGRIDHVISGDQAGADMERVQQLQQLTPPIHVELEPGDALFFHCNLLHTSAQNNSPDRRWALAIAYNKAANDPLQEHHHPKYTKLNKVPNSSILTSTEEWDVANKDFFTTAIRQQEQDRLKGRSSK